MNTRKLNQWAARADTAIDRFLDGTLLPLLLGVTLAAFICKIARIA